MRIIKTKAYLYNELSDIAKQKARDSIVDYGRNDAYEGNY
jgi:hypothetical protein